MMGWGKTLGWITKVEWKNIIRQNKARAGPPLGSGDNISETTY